jgi:signal transduction histidine kinase
VLLNLLSNAVKYTPEGGKISVTMEARPADIRVAIADNGIGIPIAQQSQIFKKFFRAENAVEKKIDGTCLGLVITKQVVEMSGGQIGFESEENRGTTFWFTLPLTGSTKKTGSRTLS